MWYNPVALAMAGFPERLQVILRPLVVEDIRQVVKIEKESFPTIWTGTSFRRELNNRMASYIVVSMSRCSVNQQVDEDSEKYGSNEKVYLLKILAYILDKVNKLLPVNIVNTPPEYYILGYLGMWYMVDEAHITSIAVNEKWRGKGIGELLLVGCIQMAMRRQSRLVSLEVRVSNKIAKALYEKYKFQEVGIKRRYYSDNNEDAFIMNLEPINTIDYRDNFDEVKRDYLERYGYVIDGLG